MVSVGLCLLYLPELFFVEGLQPLLGILELLDSLFAELMAPVQQVVQALEVQVLGPLAVADAVHHILLAAQREVDQVVLAAQPTKR